MLPSKVVTVRPPATKMLPTLGVEYKRMNLAQQPCQLGLQFHEYKGATEPPPGYAEPGTLRYVMVSVVLDTTVYVPLQQLETSLITILSPDT